MGLIRTTAETSYTTSEVGSSTKEAHVYLVRIVNESGVHVYEDYEITSTDVILACNFASAVFNREYPHVGSRYVTMPKYLRALKEVNG